MHVILLDIGGQFSARKFAAKVRSAYDKYHLEEVFGPDPHPSTIQKNKHFFIKTVLASLHVFTCMDAAEFNMSVRSLSSFLRKNKSVGLLAIDGLHFVEN